MQWWSHSSADNDEEYATSFAPIWCVSFRNTGLFALLDGILTSLVFFLLEMSRVVTWWTRGGELKHNMHNMFASFWCNDDCIVQQILCEEYAMSFAPSWCINQHTSNPWCLWSPVVNGVLFLSDARSTAVELTTSQPHSVGRCLSSEERFYCCYSDVMICESGRWSSWGSKSFWSELF